TLIRISYDDQYPWPNSADGAGYSLVTRQIDPYIDQDDARQWTASSISGGTPGRDDAVAAAVQEPKSDDLFDFALDANYPNPFNSRTTITFYLPRVGHARLAIINLLGQQVDLLIDQQLDSGRHRVQWDGSHLAAGVYFYRLQCDDGSLFRKLTLLK
ncbi:MAG: T9SS C-terminal target domain-containing protein, partial [Calditrichaeota bacterium]